MNSLHTVTVGEAFYPEYPARQAIYQDMFTPDATGNLAVGVTVEPPISVGRGFEKAVMGDKPAPGVEFDYVGDGVGPDGARVSHFLGVFPSEMLVEHVIDGLAERVKILADDPSRAAELRVQPVFQQPPHVRADGPGDVSGRIGRYGI